MVFSVTAISLVLLAAGGLYWFFAPGGEISGTVTPPRAAASPSPSSSAPQAPAAASRYTARRQRMNSGDVWEQIVLTGGASGVTQRLWVWLPPEYHQPRFRGHAFPVLITHSGFAGHGYNSFTSSSLDAPSELRKTVEAGRSHPFILVAPELQGGPDAEYDAELEANGGKWKYPGVREKYETECSDIPGQPRVGTWMNVDVPNLVRARYRAIGDRSGWGITGASSGGFCAFKLGMQYPERYGAAASVSGYFEPQSRLWAKGSPEREANNPSRLVLQRPDIPLYATWGRKDTSRTLNEKFRTLVQAPTTIDSHVGAGKHLTADMRALLAPMYTWFTGRLAAPRPLKPGERPTAR